MGDLGNSATEDLSKALVPYNNNTQLALVPGEGVKDLTPNNSSIRNPSEKITPPANSPKADFLANPNGPRDPLTQAFGSDPVPDALTQTAPSKKFNAPNVQNIENTPSTGTLSNNFFDPPSAGEIANNLKLSNPEPGSSDQNFINSVNKSDHLQGISDKYANKNMNVPNDIETKLQAAQESVNNLAPPGVKPLVPSLSDAEASSLAAKNTGSLPTDESLKSVNLKNGDTRLAVIPEQPQVSNPKNPGELLDSATSFTLDPEAQKFLDSVKQNNISSTTNQNPAVSSSLGDLGNPATEDLSKALVPYNNNTQLALVPGEGVKDLSPNNSSIRNPSEKITPPANSPKADFLANPNGPRDPLTQAFGSDPVPDALTQTAPSKKFNAPNVQNIENTPSTGTLSNNFFDPPSAGEIANNLKLSNPEPGSSDQNFINSVNKSDHLQGIADKYSNKNMNVPNDIETKLQAAQESVNNLAPPGVKPLVPSLSDAEASSLAAKNTGSLPTDESLKSVNLKNGDTRLAVIPEQPQVSNTKNPGELLDSATSFTLDPEAQKFLDSVKQNNISSTTNQNPAVSSSLEDLGNPITEDLSKALVPVNTNTQLALVPGEGVKDLTPHNSSIRNPSEKITPSKPGDILPDSVPISDVDKAQSIKNQAIQNSAATENFPELGPTFNDSQFQANADKAQSIKSQAIQNSAATETFPELGPTFNDSQFQANADKAQSIKNQAIQNSAATETFPELGPTFNDSQFQANADKAQSIKSQAIQNSAATETFPELGPTFNDSQFQANADKAQSIKSQAIQNSAATETFPELGPTFNDSQFQANADKAQSIKNQAIQNSAATETFPELGPTFNDSQFQANADKAQSIKSQAIQNSAATETFPELGPTFNDSQFQANADKAQSIKNQAIQNSAATETFPELGPTFNDSQFQASADKAQSIKSQAIQNHTATEEFPESRKFI